jgi:sporulation protein YlmC with PRC-barrel domain
MAAMAEAQGFTIGAKANCSDGFCGEVSRMIIDPVARAVTHLVVEPKHRGEPGRLVPLDLAETAGREITLRCTLAEFDRLDPAEETELVDGPGYGGGYGSAESVQGYGGGGGMGVGGSVSGLGIGADLGHHVRTIVEEAVPLGETQVRRGEHVHALDGEIGRVQGFVVAGDQQVTHVLLEEGHLWGKKEVAIPMRVVTAVDDGIRLSITKKQVEELPPAQ